MLTSIRLKHSDQQLAQRLGVKDEGAFKALVDRFQEKVLNTCLGFVPNREDAEDLTQEVFWEVHRSIEQFRAEAKLSTWIYRIAVNKSLEHIRRNKRQKRQSQLQSLFGIRDAAAPHASRLDHPGLSLENKERAEVLFGAIDKLPENQRIAFTLAKVEGLSYQEIVEVMGVSLGSVESLVFRARKKLKEHLYAYYKE